MRVDALPGGKQYVHEFRSIIPDDTPLGSWAVGAEVQSENSRLGGALVSFDVVDKYEVEVRLPGKDVSSDGRGLGIPVSITNNLQRDIHGTAKITLPPGWELWRSADTRNFAVSRQSTDLVVFRAKPPVGAAGRAAVRSW